MEESEYLLKVNEITDTCVLAEGKRLYRVKWKSTWISDQVIPPKVFQKTQNGKVHITGNNTTYEILDEKQTVEGHVDFLLSCSESWEDEEKLQRNKFQSAISLYWAKLNTKELIKIEETSDDDDSQSCCMMKNKSKLAEPTTNPLPTLPSIKGEKSKHLSQCCSANLTEEIQQQINVDISIQDNLHTSDIDISGVNESSLDSAYNEQILNSQDISTALLTLQPSSPSSITPLNSVKPEKGVYTNSCAKQSFNHENNVSLTSPDNNSSNQPQTLITSNQSPFLSSTYDLPTDRFSPNTIKIEDDYPHEDLSISTSPSKGTAIQQNSPFLITNSVNNINVSSSPVSPPRIQTGLNSSSSSSSLLPTVIKIEDDDDPVHCNQQAPKVPSLSSLRYQHPTNQPSFPSLLEPQTKCNASNVSSQNPRLPSFSHLESNIFPQVTCKAEPPDDFPTVNGQNSHPPELIDYSTHPSVTGTFPADIVKIEELFNKDCHQKQSLDIEQSRDNVRLIPDLSRPRTITPVEKRTSPPDKPPLLIPNPDKPPLLIPNGMAVPNNFSHNIHRYGESNYNPEQNGNRLSHHNHIMSGIPNNDTRRYQMSQMANNSSQDNIPNHQCCDICGKLFADFNALYDHRISHGNDRLIHPMMKIKEEKDLDYRSSKDGGSLPKDVPMSKELMYQNQNYFPTNNALHVQNNYSHNVSRNDEAYLASIARKKQYNAQIPNSHNFRFQGSCNVQTNRVMYSPNQNQYMNSNGHDPTLSMTHRHSLIKNKEAFYPSHMKSSNIQKSSCMPELIHGVPGNFAHNIGGKQVGREIPPGNTRDAYLAVNGHNISPHSYPVICNKNDSSCDPKLSTHHHQIAINPEEARCRINDASVNQMQYYSASNPSFLPRDHMLSASQGMCKPVDQCNPCINHEKHVMQQHSQMLSNPTVIRPHQINHAESQRFHHAASGMYMIGNRHPGPYSSQASQNICMPISDKQQQASQRMQIIGNTPQIRYHPSLSAVPHRQFYPTQSQQYLPPSNHIVPNNMPPTLTKMPEHYSPPHNDLQSIQQRRNETSGQIENRQMVNGTMENPQLLKGPMENRRISVGPMDGRQLSNPPIESLRLSSGPLEMSNDLTDSRRMSSGSLEKQSGHMENRRLSNGPIEMPTGHMDNRRLSSGPMDMSNGHMEKRRLSSGPTDIPNGPLENRRLSSGPIEMSGGHMENRRLSSGSMSNGSIESRQISPNYPKCDLCGKQFADYVSLNEHRVTHTNEPISMPRVQIKEEADSDYQPVINNSFRKDVPIDFIYPTQHPYIPGNVHRHPINSTNPSNDFQNKPEAHASKHNLPIPSDHTVSNSNAFNISQHENSITRIIRPEQQPHGQFTSNPSISRYPNPADPRYLTANGHIIPNNTYPTSSPEDTSTNNISPNNVNHQEPSIGSSNLKPSSAELLEKMHECDVCGQPFADYSKLKEHRKTHANEKHFSCSLCDKTFTQNSTLKRHQRTHTREKPYKCEICGKSFSHNYNLKEHGKTHTGEKPYKCNVCEKTFAQNYHLKEHQTTHSDAKPFKCDKCNKQFSLDSYLKKHQKIHTGEKPYKCDVCDKQFLQNSHLKDHRRIHTGEKPFKCEICGIRFSQNYTLKIHQRTHTGEKPYKCEICQKRFSQNSHLKEHRTRTHSGDKPFKCDQCHKEFSLDSYLKKHQKIHSGEKPFKCDICEKQFSQNYHLKEHRRIHTGEKPYKCQICEMRFSQNCSLKIHQRIHTGEKPYECEICGKQFSHSSNVKTHKRVHLNEKAKANANQQPTFAIPTSVSKPVSTENSETTPPVSDSKLSVSTFLPVAVIVTS